MVVMNCNYLDLFITECLLLFSKVGRGRNETKEQCLLTGKLRSLSVVLGTGDGSR